MIEAEKANFKIVEYVLWFEADLFDDPYVSAETRERVQRVMRELKLRAEPARSLARSAPDEIPR